MSDIAREAVRLRIKNKKRIEERMGSMDNGGVNQSEVEQESGDMPQENNQEEQEGEFPKEDGIKGKQGEEADIEQKEEERRRQEQESKDRQEEKLKQESRQKAEDLKKNKEEELKKKREKYAEEFKPETLNVDSVNPENYTRALLEDDLKYLGEWLSHERERYIWLREEMEQERQRRIDMAVNGEERTRANEWASAIRDRLFQEWNKKNDEIKTKERRAIEINYHKKDIQKEQEELKKRRQEEENRKKQAEEQRMKEEREKREFERKKQEDERKRKEKERAEEERKRQGQKKHEEQKGSKKTDEQNRASGKQQQEKPRKHNGSEATALKDLNISQGEYDDMVRNAKFLGEREFASMLAKVFGVSEMGEMKKAYRQRAREWHSDVNGNNEVNENKLKIANLLYQEFKRRYKNT
ncbi:MAG: hypothetical protein ACD_11C00121G0001 [uncultured bacterium]|nr:MAG: hypothetical protein ACD_11C00121G0001 [uncultured bacterium]